MSELLAWLAGALVSCGVFLLLRPNLVRVLFGLVLLSNGVNLAVVVAGRVAASAPPLVPPGAEAPATAVANPVPQALVLTALVISFGLTSFALVLVARTRETLGTVDPERLP